MSFDFGVEADVLAVLQQHFAFPDTFIVLDLETSGYSKDRDFIVDAGWAVVKNRQVVHSTSLLLDWSRVPNVDHAFLKSQLRRQAADYAQQGRPHYYSWDRLCSEGEDPADVLFNYTKLIYDHLQDPDARIVGHGFWRFDRGFIDGHTRRFQQGYQLPWRKNSIFDTGLLEKAAQICSLPRAEDTLDDWMQRINNANVKGVKWNLENHCAPKYRLAERYQLNMQNMHTAGFDCVLTACLLDTFQQLTEILNGQRQTLTSNIRIA